MEFQTLKILVGETAAHVWHGGKGYPVLLMHGAGPGTTAMANFSKVREALAEEGAPANVLVNAINPGPIETERIRYMCEAKAEIEGITVEEARREMGSETMVKRFGEPREVAALFAFLASSRASFMTG